MKLVPKAIFPNLVAIEAGDAVAVSDDRERILAHISRDAWAMLRQVDGVRTLEAIAETVGLAGREDTVWRCLDELAQAGLIARLTPPAGTGPLHRRQMLSGALYTGAALGLAAAAPVFAATTGRQGQDAGADEGRWRGQHQAGTKGYGGPRTARKGVR